ncbi:double zinc ribbon domain-containing protein [Halobiforma nitratireducens]|uniref:FHA domain-containing protein n=1 Tax=Halobiforma nitratireducens JCM 10879 TaxID=1227454 RepID=M0MKJ2_9EURY|nr:zinc ribbon domain-containing protein [Halobiforma nitratireducens]EMA46207.1 FHA domain-containing protein [Halobiforma nitratireducens JCM 10879]
MPEQTNLECVSCDTSFEPGPNGGFCPSCDTPHPDYAGGDGDGGEETTEDDSESAGEDEPEDVVDEAETDESQVDDDSGSDEQEEPAEESESDDESVDDEPEEGAAEPEPEPEPETEEDDAGEDQLEETTDEPAGDESGVDGDSDTDQAGEPATVEDDSAADEDADETCHACGAAVDASMAFCPECGAELEDDDESALTACPSCENAVDDESYCPSCGLHLDPIREGEESAESVSTPDVPEEATLVINGEEYTFGDGDTFGRQDGEWLEDLVEASGGRDEVTYVSSEHLEFAVEDDGIYVVDVSTNGTKHNGTEIDGASAKLEDGDTLELADRAELEVTL